MRDREPSPLEEAIDERIRLIVRQELAVALAKLRQPAEYLSTAEAAELARVAPGTVRRWVREGRLPTGRVGRELRVRRVDVERLMAGGGGDGDASDREIEAMAEAAAVGRVAKRASRAK